MKWWEVFADGGDRGGTPYGLEDIPTWIRIAAETLVF